MLNLWSTRQEGDTCHNKQDRHTRENNIKIIVIIVIKKINKFKKLYSYKKMNR